MTKQEIDKWIEDNHIAIGAPLNSGIPRYIKKNLLKDFQRETNSNSGNPTELLYLYLNPSVNRKCPICGQPLKFQNFYNGYRKACSSKCSHALTAQKGKETNLERYGVSNPMQREEIKAKQKRDEESYKLSNLKAQETLLKKYGANNPMKIKEFKDRLVSNNLEKYGVNNPAKLESSKAKTVQTCLEKYGVEYYSQTEKAKNNLKDIRIRKMLDDIFNNNRLLNVEPLFKKEDYKGVHDKNSKAIFYPFRCKVCGTEFEAHLDNGNIPICRHCHPYITEEGISSEEKELRNFVESICKDPVIYNDRSVLKGKELDIYIPSKKVAIEYDGIYWHTEENGKDVNYHLNKTKECEAKGIRLIHIFSDEWILKKPICESIINAALNPMTKIGARKCEVKYIRYKEASNFLEQNHIQGYSYAYIKIGLFYKGELVSVCTFSTPRFNKGYKWELTRYVDKLNTRIVGGLSKMLAFFRKNHPGSIITYSDRAKFTGEGYRKIFKELSPTRPSYYYTDDFLHRQNRLSFKKEDLLSWHPEYKNLTEKEIMSLLGYYRIYDCGNWKFEIKKEDD